MSGFSVSSGTVFDFINLTNFLVFGSLVAIAFIAIDYVRILVYSEVAILSINLSLVFSSAAIDDFLGQVFVIFILSVIAAESAIGLSIFVLVYRSSGSMFVFLVREFTADRLLYNYENG